MSFVRPARFLISGAANTAVGLAVIYCGMWVGLGDISANAVGYAVGVTVSFVLNRTWTFDDHGYLVTAALRFILAVAIAYLANLATMLVARDWLDFNSWLAQALAVGPYTLILYWLSHQFVFRGSQGSPVSNSTRSSMR